MLWFYHYTDEAGYQALTSGRQFRPSGIPFTVSTATVEAFSLDGNRIEFDAEQIASGELVRALGVYFAIIAKFPDKVFPAVSADAAYGKGWYVTDLPPSTPTDELLAALWPGGATLPSRTEYWLLLAAREDRVRIPEAARPNVSFLPLCTGFTCTGESPRPKISSNSSIYLLEAGTRREEGKTLSSLQRPLVLVPSYMAFVDGFYLLSQQEQRRLLLAFGEALFDNEDPLEWLRRLHPEVVGTRLDASDGPDVPGVSVATLFTESADPGVGDWTSLSDALYSAGHFAAALACANAALEQGPYTPEAWLNRGASLSALNEYDDAIAAYDRALEYRPDYQQAGTNKGGLLVKRGHYAEAVALLETVLAAEPENLSALNNKATALSRLGRLDEAIAVYEQALTIDQQLPEVWNGLGAVLFEQLQARGQPLALDALSRVLESFWRALQIRPAYASARENLRQIVAIMEAPTVHHLGPLLLQIAQSDPGILISLIGQALTGVGVQLHPRYLVELSVIGEIELAQIGGTDGTDLGFLVSYFQGEMTEEDWAEHRIRLLFHMLSTALTRAGLATAASKLAEESLRHAHSAGERLQIAKELNDCGVTLRAYGDFEGSLVCYRLAKLVYAQEGDRKFAGHVSYNVGRVYQARGAAEDFEKAVHAYSEALMVYRQLGMSRDARDTEKRLRELQSPSGGRRERGRRQ